MTKELLQKRKQVKKKKGTFTRHDSHKKKRIGTGYKKPKGLQSKSRLNKRGYVKKVTSGYRSPKKVKGLDGKTGLKPVMISAIGDMKDIKKEKEAVIIKSSVGKRKLGSIIDEAKKRGIQILNWKDPNAHKQQIEQDFMKKKEKKVAEKKKQEEKKKKDEKKAKKSIEQKVDAEEKKEESKEEKKKELDKLLTKG